MESESFNPFAAGEILRVAPTTAPQKEILTSARISDVANTAFNEGIVISIIGDVDCNLLKKSLNIIYNRHDILRSTFTPSGKDMCLMGGCELNVHVEDLTHMKHEVANRKLDQLLRNIAVSPMNLEEGPLFHAWICKMPGREIKLVIAVHHIVCDGWSFGIVLDELQKLYNGNGESTVLSDAPSFMDYSEEQSAKEVVNEDIDHWLRKYENVPDALELPLDRPRPTVRTFEADRIDYKFPQYIVDTLPAFASSLKASVVNVTLSAYIALLYRLTGNHDIVVGLPVAGQATTGEYKLLGHMVQLLPIRVNLGDSVTFESLVSSVKEEVLNATEHAKFTFGKLLENIPSDRSRVPLISTLFNIDQPSEDVVLGNSRGSVASIHRAAESFELFLNLVPSSDQITIEATFSSVLFERDSVVSWLETLSSILAFVLNRPASLIDEIALCEKIPDVVNTLNQTERELNYGDVLAAFSEQVKDTPNKTAISCGSATFTYGELNDLTNNLANRLKSIGMKKGALIGICCDRSAELVISAFAILKIGAAYLPLDPEFPVERLLYVLSDSGADAVIVDEAAPQAIKESGLPQLVMTGEDVPDEKTETLQHVNVEMDDVAYTIYTSGSTGKPKGVVVSRGAMINFIESMAQTPGIEKKDRLLAVTTLSFDISVLELFLPLCYGAEVVIATSDENRDGAKLAKLIDEKVITIMQATPGTWRMLLSSDWRDCSSRSDLKLKALVGGESLPSDLIRELIPRVKELWNMYGPTETTVWSTCKQIKRSNDIVSIGKPISNTKVYILDGNLNIQPLSAPGELVICGRGLANGYHNRAELTEEKFILHPKLGRLYRTGDIARFLPGGELQHLGRKDDQVKLRGFRIELGEIEAVLTDMGDIKQAAVYLWKLSEEDVRVVACYISHKSADVNTVAVRRHLRERLPSYMIPQYFLRVDEIPTTPNGKINRRLLPKPEVGSTLSLTQNEVKTEIEKTIAELWQGLIKTSRSVCNDDNFFEVGGHSLLALEFIRKLEYQTGVRLTPEDIVTKSLKMLADKVTKKNNELSSEKSVPAALPQAALRRLTLDQLQMVQESVLDATSTYWNLPASWVFTGDIDRQALKQSLLKIVERQSAFRTMIISNAGSYELRLLSVNDFDCIEEIDYSAEAEPLMTALETINRSSAEPFEVNDQLLVRIYLITLSENSLMLGIVPHQLIFDGWSFDIFLKELEEQYVATLEGRVARNETLCFQFRDYCEWLNTQTINEKNLSYHKKTINVARINELYKNFGTGRGKVERITRRLNESKLCELGGVANKNKWRLHEVLLSVFLMSLSDQLKEKDIIIAMPVTGRYMPESIGLIGSFVSMLPAVFHIETKDGYNNTQHVIRQLREFYKYEQFTLGELIREASIERNELLEKIPFSFSYQDVRMRPAEFGPLELVQYDIDRNQLEYPIEAWVRVENEGLQLNIDYDAARTEQDVAISLIERVLEIISGLEEVLSVSESEMQGGDAVSGPKGFWKKLFS
jgi:amino acid adenylation domain-containing protein